MCELICNKANLCEVNMSFWQQQIVQFAASLHKDLIPVLSNAKSFGHNDQFA